MGQTPDAVRAEIEGTRADMSLTLDAIGDKVSPRQAARRQVRQARNRLDAARDRIMGTVDHASGTISDMGGGATGQAQDLGQSLREAPERAKSQTQGNPLAAGLIAFGAGLLAASVLPATDRERQVASKVGEAAQPAVEHAQAAAQELKQHVQSTAQDAMGQIKDTASAASAQVKQEGSSSAHDLAGSATDAAGEVRSQAQESVSQPGDSRT